MKLGELESGVKRLAAQFKPIIDLGDLLNQLGSLEKHESEVKARLSIAKRDLELVNAEKASVNSYIAETEKLAKDKEQAAIEQAKIITKDAENEAKEIVLEAQGAAKQIIDACEAQKDLLDKYRMEYAGIDKKIASKKKEFDTLVLNIAEERERAKKMLGL
jgi:cell division septum initiation protein DivIVA